MAGKLGESTWTAFTKAFTKTHKQDLDDKALVKAQAAFDKTDESKPEPRLAALDDVVEQLKKQVVSLAKRKKELGDKPFGEAKDKLHELLDSAEKLLESATQAVADAKADDDDDDEDDTSAVLTIKMVPLVRLLPKGEARLPAMIGSISKTAAVLISKKSITSSKRKLLSDALDAQGGVKFAKGECHYEKATKTLHFVMEGKIAGLAKRVRAAMLNQTGLRLKVKLRGEDGEDLDGEEEEVDDAVAAGAPGAQADATAAAAGRPAPPKGPASAEQLSVVQRLRKVRDAYDAALKAQHPESTQLRALVGFASEKAEAGAFAAASQALDRITPLLALGGGAQSGQAPAADPQALVTRLSGVVFCS